MRKSMFFRDRRFPFAVSLAVLLAAPSAYAGDPAAAQGLFNDAKKLMADEHWAEACPKLEESERLDPEIGTLFNLANCHEHIGRTATAWAEFLEVAATAKARAQTAREKAARDRAAALEPKLTRMTISLTTEPPGLSISRDGEVVGRGQWGAPVPVDPGDHLIVATAPGKHRWEKSLRIAADTKNVDLGVPTLADEPPLAPLVVVAPLPPPAPVPIAPAPTEPPRGQTQRTSGLIVAGAGIVSLGIGAVFGLSSKAKHDDSDPHCDGNNHCDATGVSLRDDAIQAGTISSIGFGIGGAALFTGAVLFFTAPTGKAQSARIQASPLIGQNSSGLSVRGTW
jgi:hypothetical protein